MTMKKRRRNIKRSFKTESSHPPKLQRVQRQAKKRTPSSKTSQRVAKAIAKMRTEGSSLRKASVQAGVAPATVIKWASRTLQKSERGRYTAKTTDRLVRELMIPTAHGTEEISVRGLPAASLLGRYWSAVHKYYESGDVSSLETFRGKYVVAVGGKKYPLLTDLEILNRLGSAGVVSFESLYARS